MPEQQHNHLFYHVMEEDNNIKLKWLDGEQPNYASSDYQTGSGYNATSDNQAGFGCNIGSRFTGTNVYHIGMDNSTGNFLHSGSGWNAVNVYMTRADDDFNYQGDSRANIHLGHGGDYLRTQKEMESNKRKERHGEFGALPTVGFVLREKPEVKKDPENARSPKIEEKIAVRGIYAKPEVKMDPETSTAVSGGRYAKPLKKKQA